MRPLHRKAPAAQSRPPQSGAQEDHRRGRKGALALRRRGCARQATGLFLALLVAACAGEEAIPRTHPVRLIVLGVDGMDPNLTRQYIREGRLPNLAALAEKGSFLDLATSDPPQSPVAWSYFITGQSSKGHGIYDFVHRDPKEMGPYLSTSRAHDPEHTLSAFGYEIPLSSAKVELLREGEAFWETLEKKNIPVTVVKVPANFPPDEHWKSETLSGMGTPDLLGTYGVYQMLTNDPKLAQKKVKGGIVHPLDFGEGQTATALLTGPPNPILASREPLEEPITVTVDKKRPVALVQIGKEKVLLQPGEWSEWVPVIFQPGSLLGEAQGMVRFYLQSLTPHFTLYVSPINIDPKAPLMPISSPRDYAQKLAEDVGRFYTQGMPEETQALGAGVLSDDEFLAQADIIYQEEKAILDRELARFDGGVLFFYFSVIDQVSHMFYRALDPNAPPEVKKYADVIPNLYARIDGVIGEILEKAGPETTVIIMSDHGFGPYKYKVHLNDWLLEQGYLSLREGSPGEGPLGHIDWEKTQAYALGLNQLFLNLKGRERQGVVPEEEREIILDRLSNALKNWRNPETGERVVTRVTRVEPGAFPDRAPDLIVGYNRGYRSSDESATGGFSGQTLSPNKDKWAGDHCGDPAHFPGVLFSNRKIAVKQASLVDLAPTILRFFGIEPPSTMEGKDIFQEEGQTL